MQKMFTTQLAGLFKRILDKEEFQIEDSARLLSQSCIGEGAIYIKGYKEMGGIVFEALEGEEPLHRAAKLESVTALTEVDRVLLITRYADDEDALSLGEALSEKGIPFISISGNKKGEGKSLSELADIHLNTQVVKPLLPKEDGTRVGFPSLIAATYLYFLLKFTIDEILEEYNS